MPEESASVDSPAVSPEESSRNTAHPVSLSRCPICRARLLENPICPRCGSDLSLPLQIALDAKHLERVAVAHLLSGEWALAKSRLVAVQRLHGSEISRQLLAFVDYQLTNSTHAPGKHSPTADSMDESDSLANLDLSMIERYG